MNEKSPYRLHSFSSFSNKFHRSKAGSAFPSSTFYLNKQTVSAFDVVVIVVIVVVIVAGVIRNLSQVTQSS